MSFTDKAETPDNYSDLEFDELLKIAEQGDSEAQFEISIRLIEDLDNVNYEDAFYWCLRSSFQGNLKAIHRIGMFYEDGILVEESIGKATCIYKYAADKGSAESKAELGEIYSRALENDDYLEKAITYLLEAAKANDANALMQLSRLYDEGRLNKEQSDFTIKMFVKHAEEGNYFACVFLSVVFLFSDFDKSSYWINKCLDVADGPNYAVLNEYIVLFMHRFKKDDKNSCMYNGPPVGLDDDNIVQRSIFIAASESDDSCYLSYDNTPSKPAEYGFCVSNRNLWWRNEGDSEINKISLKSSLLTEPYIEGRYIIIGENERISIEQILDAYKEAICNLLRIFHIIYCRYHKFNR